MVSDYAGVQLLNLMLSSASLMISLVVLLVHIKNRRTQVRTYTMARDTLRSSTMDLKFVASEQLEDKVLIRLVLFNPGSCATIIQSLTIYKELESEFFLLRWLGRTQWKEQRRAQWWPTSDPDCKDQKYFADEYKSLYVEDCRDILILLPGYIDRNSYRFVIKTNHGSYSHTSTIDATISYFSHDFYQWYREA